MPELWVPGAADASLDDFVALVHKRIQAYAGEHGLASAAVEIEFVDGAAFWVERISPEPGFGFVTLRPHPDEGEPEEDVIVPVGSIRRITIAAVEEHRARFGFSLPEGT
jgi:hypothetical protein